MMAYIPCWREGVVAAGKVCEYFWQPKEMIRVQEPPALDLFDSELVFEGPVSRLEKDRDRTGPGPIKTGNYQD